MHTIQAAIIIVGVLTIGWLLLQNVIRLTELITKKKYRLSSIFFNFKQKMWMTIGLGVIFFGLYCSILFLGSFKLDSKAKLTIFLQAYNNPIGYAYLGLSIFIGISISIYLARMVIIYLYNSKKR